MNIRNEVALCNNLNMDFDEALELFSEESLQSMQMAKVNGGTTTWRETLNGLLKALGVEATVEAIKAAWDKLFGPTSPTPASQNMTITKTQSVSIEKIRVEFSAGNLSFSLDVNAIVITSTTTAPTKN